MNFPLNKIFQLSVAGIFIFSSLLLFVSCKKLVTVDSPTDQLISATVFNSDQSAESAVNGLYSQMIKGNTLFASNGMSIYPGMSGDDLYCAFPGANDQFWKNNINPANSIVQNNLWSFGYKFIYQANSIIEGLSASTSISSPVKNQLLGEAKFVRAFCYFYFVNLFGDVPLITATDYKTNSNVSRIPSAQVYDFIMSDLKEAQALLLTTYPSPGKVRPNKLTATALLARVYLYQNQFASAESMADSVINAGLYDLTNTSLTDAFLANNKEAIWQLMPVAPNYNTWEGNAFIPSPGQKPVYALTQFLLAAFEPGDLRKTNWTKTVTVNGITYSFPFKYKIKSGNPVTEFYVMFRLAEQYLIRAEARANQNNFSGAMNDINIIRKRAGLSLLTLNDKALALLAIEHERQTELFAEWGHRWFDLKRTGRINAILGAEKPADWQATDALYPIPFTEIQKNPLLAQNPGY